MSESLVDPNILYASTTDAQVWATLNGGNNWTKVSSQLPYRYVSDVVASPEFQQTVYVAHSGYKDNDNTPLLHRSDDGGNSWQSIAGDLPTIAINEILVLPEREDSVLFVGTDAGVYATLDGGGSWNRLGGNMPMIPINDLVWNEAKNELVVGSFARGILSFPLDVILDLETTSVESTLADQIEINIFPNPVIDGVWVELKTQEAFEILELKLFNAEGKLVEEQHFTKVETIKSYIEMERFSERRIFLKRTGWGRSAYQEID